MRKTDPTLFTETTNGAASCHQKPWLDRWMKRGLARWIRWRVREEDRRGLKRRGREKGKGWSGVEWRVQADGGRSH